MSFGWTTSSLPDVFDRDFDAQRIVDTFLVSNSLNARSLEDPTEHWKPSESRSLRLSFADGSVAHYIYSPLSTSSLDLLLAQLHLLSGF